MLSELRLRDYKSYRDEVRVPLRRITVLLGKNSSGKTAAARLPLLLFGALSQHPFDRRDPVPLSVRTLRYGSNLTEMVHGESAHASFGIGCRIHSAHFDAPDLTLAFDIQLRRSLGANLSSFVTAFEATPLLRRLAWDGNTRDPAALRYTDPSVRGFDGLLPRFQDERNERVTERLARGSSRYLGELVHLTSLRHPLRTLYEARSSAGEWHAEGGDAVYMLNESDQLMERVADWYQTSLGTRIAITQEPSSFGLASYNSHGGSHSLALAGQGIQQVLPVVTQLNAMSLGVGGRTLVVEEPELNLHPAAHGPIADLIVSALSGGGQLLVETHSENLVLRLRYHVATGRLSPDDINILWFQNDGSDTSVRQIEITPDGAVTDWPSGVFAEDLDEARAIAKASRR